MDKEQYDQLKNKYLEGNTTLEEEKSLLEYNRSSGQDPWLAYVKNQKLKEQPSINDELWENSVLDQSTRSKTKTYPWKIILISFIIIASFSGYFIKKNIDFKQKSMKLKQAIALVERQSTEAVHIEKEIIYKDELVTIFLTSN